MWLVQSQQKFQYGHSLSPRRNHRVACPGLCYPGRRRGAPAEVHQPAPRTAGGASLAPSWCRIRCSPGSCRSGPPTTSAPRRSRHRTGRSCVPPHQPSAAGTSAGRATGTRRRPPASTSSWSGCRSGPVLERIDSMIAISTGAGEFIQVRAEPFCDGLGRTRVLITEDDAVLTRRSLSSWE